MPGGRLQPQLLSAKVLKGRKQSRAASEIQGEEKCLPLQGPDQKKVLETPQQRPFRGRSCGPLLLSASLLLLTLLSSLLTLLALSPREEGMKGWCLEINISKSISEGCCLELPDRPACAGAPAQSGPGADLACVAPRSFCACSVISHFSSAAH